MKVPTNKDLASCIKITGKRCAPRKKPVPRKKAPVRFGPLKKGELSKYGYVNVISMNATMRRRALLRAMRGISKQKRISHYKAGLTLIRKLNAVYILTRKTSPKSSKVFESDRKWMSSYIKKLKVKQ